MRKRRKTLSLLLAVSLALGSFGSSPSSSASLGKVQAAELEEPSGPLSGTCGVEGNNITWELVEDPDGELFPEEGADTQPACYELILTGTGGFDNGIAYWGSYSAYITTVTINEGITAIGSMGLANLYSLKSITLPDSVTSIGSYVFNGDLSLETIICGSGLETIGSSAFSSLFSLTNVQLNDGLKEIGMNAFQSCDKLTEITLPESLTTIKNSAFKTTSLTSIRIPGNVEEIGYEAFRGSKLESVQLNEGLKKIGAWAFADCSLAEITLPESLTAIGECAFYHTSLSSIAIPSNVAEITHSPFPGAPLATIEVDAGSQHFFVANNTLYEKKEDGSPKRAIAYANSDSSSSVEILDGTELIDNFAFYHAQSLSSVKMPESLTAIGQNAFSECKLLHELHLPANLTQIGSHAFSYCSSITEASIPDNVSALGSSVFQQCLALTTVSIGKSVPSLETPFILSKNIAKVTVSPENPYLESSENVVYSKDHTKLYYYAPKKQDTSYHILEQVQEVCSRAIEDADALEKLYFPASLKTISIYGISSNPHLASIYFAGNAPESSGSNNRICYNAKNLILYKSASATGWKDTAFGSPTADWDPSNTTQDSGSLGGISWEYTGSEGRLTLTGSGQLADFSKASPAPWSLYMGAIQSVKGDNITGIGDYGFCNASKLFQVETAASLEYAGDYAFSGCGKLKSINISAIRTIGAAAFAENTSLPENLTLEKVSSMGEGAFQGCTSISSATLGFCLTDLEKEVFKGCTRLSSFLIPDSVSTIGEGAFQGCTSLRSINIPSDTCSIGAQAFSGDASLEKVYFYGTIPANWAEDSFEGCHSSLNLCYRARQTSWARLNGTWNGIPLLRQERFYQEGEDHFSFANSSESFGYPADYHFPKRRYWEALGNPCLGTYYYIISPSWTGSCYGMAAATLEFYENPGRFPVSSYSPSAGTLYGIAAPGHKDAPLTQLIESCQISQYHPLISGCAGALNANRDDYRGLVQKIEEFERSGGLRVDSNAEPLALVLYASFSGHVVIPVSVSQTAEGDFLIMAYNPNAPAGLEAITINKDFSGVKGSYNGISYVPYRTIAASCSIDSQSGGIQRSGSGRQNPEDDSLYLSIDKRQGMVTDASENGIDGIAGAYEQKPLAAGDGDTFTGIRSFVLPEGNYQLSANMPEGGDGDTDSITFYMGSKDCFAEVATSDEQAALNVSKTGTQDGALVLELKSSSTEGETASITLVNSQGKERSIGLNSSSAAISLETNDAIKIQAPGQDSITVDGEKISLQDGQASFSFPKSTDSGDSDNSGSSQPGSGNGGSSGGKEPGSDNSGSNRPSSGNDNNSGNKKPGSSSSTSQKPSASKREQAVTSIKVNVKKLTLGVGETYTLQASALPAKAKNRKLSYTASNKKLTVTSKGKITARKTGSAKITVKSSNGKKANVWVTIKKKPTKLKLNAKTKTIRTGWKFQIRAKLPKGTASHKLTYTSNRKSVAFVSPTGKVTARKKGTAIITVKTYNGKKAKMKIIVQKK